MFTILNVTLSIQFQLPSLPLNIFQTSSPKRKKRTPPQNTVNLSGRNFGGRQDTIETRYVDPSGYLGKGIHEKHETAMLETTETKQNEAHGGRQPTLPPNVTPQKQPALSSGLIIPESGRLLNPFFSGGVR